MSTPKQHLLAQAGVLVGVELLRAVEVGPWHGDDWFITSGLQAGDRVVVDNLIKLSKGIQVQNTPPPPKQTDADAEQPAEQTE